MMGTNHGETRKPYVGEVLDYKRDIAPYQQIRIYSGVGSGKNTFIENFDKLGIKYLELTSRKARVDETLATYRGRKRMSRFVDYSTDDWIERINNLYGVQIGRHDPKMVTVTTYGMVESYYCNIYGPEDNETWIETIKNINKILKNEK